MFSDILFNFTKIVQNSNLYEGAEILKTMAKSKPTFALDVGLRADDIWGRVETFKECLNLIEDESEKKILTQMIHFSAGITGSLDAIENRYECVENLENSINDFKDSDEQFSQSLVAIGPCGINHDWESCEFDDGEHNYFDNRTISDERDLFALQMTLAKKYNLPAIVYSKKGFKDTADVLKAIKWNKGVIHGYSYTKSELDFFLNLGWFISFDGTVTYSGKKNALDMAEIVAYIPKDRILIESNSPYYAPIPIKNTINTPNNINYIYDYVASKRGITSSKLGQIVEENCKKLFS